MKKFFRVGFSWKYLDCVLKCSLKCKTNNVKSHVTVPDSWIEMEGHRWWCIAVLVKNKNLKLSYLERHLKKVQCWNSSVQWIGDGFTCEISIFIEIMFHQGMVSGGTKCRLIQLHKYQVVLLVINWISILLKVNLNEWHAYWMLVKFSGHLTERELTYYGTRGWSSWVLTAKHARSASRIKRILTFKRAAKRSLTALTQNSADDSDCRFVFSSDDVTECAEWTWDFANLSCQLSRLLYRAKEMLFQNGGFWTFIGNIGGNVNKNGII